MEKISLRHIKLLWEVLAKTPYVVDFSHRNIYYDEPNFYQYSVGLAVPIKSIGKSIDFTLNGSGYSFFSRREALIKALGESCERLSLLLPNKKKIKMKKILSLGKDTFLSPSLYDESITNEKSLGWVEGKKNDSVACLIPAQLVYLAYDRSVEFDLRASSVSTGAAGAFSHKEALLGGIYEVLERDIFMNMYLAKLKPVKIKNSSIKNSELTEIFAKIQRYSLEVNIFEVHNDFDIPAYVVLIIDKTGLGQAVSAGAKVNIDPFKALQGALTEACMIRMGSHLVNLDEAVKNRKSSIVTLKDRKVFWYLPDSIKHLDFMLDQQSQEYAQNMRPLHVKNELKCVEKELKNKGFDYYHVDVSADFLEKSGYKVYKVVIPGLQQLYLDEHEKKHINIKRLHQFAQYFGVEKVVINTIPHPFL